MATIDLSVTMEAASVSGPRMGRMVGCGVSMVGASRQGLVRPVPAPQTPVPGQVPPKG